MPFKPACLAQQPHHHHGLPGESLMLDSQPTSSQLAWNSVVLLLQPCWCGLHCTYMLIGWHGTSAMLCSLAALHDASTVGRASLLPELTYTLQLPQDMSLAAVTPTIVLRPIDC